MSTTYLFELHTLAVARAAVCALLGDVDTHNACYGIYRESFFPHTHARQTRAEQINAPQGSLLDCNAKVLETIVSTVAFTESIQRHNLFESLLRIVLFTRAFENRAETLYGVFAFCNLIQHAQSDIFDVSATRIIERMLEQTAQTIGSDQARAWALQHLPRYVNHSYKEIITMIWLMLNKIGILRPEDIAARLAITSLFESNHKKPEILGLVEDMWGMPQEAQVAIIDAIQNAAPDALRDMQIIARFPKHMRQWDEYIYANLVIKTTLNNKIRFSTIHQTEEKLEIAAKTADALAQMSTSEAGEFLLRQLVQSSYGSISLLSACEHLVRSLEGNNRAPQAEAIRLVSQIILNLWTCLYAPNSASSSSFKELDNAVNFLVEHLVEHLEATQAAQETLTNHRRYIQWRQGIVNAIIRETMSNMPHEISWSDIEDIADKIAKRMTACLSSAPRQISCAWSNIDIDLQLDLLHRTA